MRSVRVGLRWLNFFILTCLSTGAVYAIGAAIAGGWRISRIRMDSPVLMNALGVVSLPLIIAALVFWIGGVVLIGKGLGQGGGTSALIILSPIMPCIGIIVFIAFYAVAVNRLKKNGYRIGFLGAAPKNG